MKTLMIMLCWLPSVTYGQFNIDYAKKRSNRIFEKAQQKPEVLLLGVFHFAGEKVDVNTTPDALRINMLDPKRQQQIKALTEQIAKFKPTKIAIEAAPELQDRIDSLYRDYLSGKPFTGKYPDNAGEMVQLAFRLAKQLRHLKLYPVNAQAFSFQLSQADSVKTFQKYQSQGDSSYDYWEPHYDAEDALQDSLGAFANLKDYLYYLNLPETRARSNGRWLVTTKRGSNTEPVGADGFITRYFNRNTRIYSNVQRIVTSKSDRILVIYGATHMYMLNMLFAASPEFSLNDILPYLK